MTAANIRPGRYVVLGLARARSAWARHLATLSTAGGAPIDYVQCMSAEEVRARLASEPLVSAVVADADLPGVDRDFLDAIRRAGSIALIVDAGSGRDWAALGAVETIPASACAADVEVVLDALRRHAVHVRRTDASVASRRAPAEAGAPGRLLAVTGPGGTGASTVAMGLAQVWATTGPAGATLLADLCCEGEQAMLHHSPDVVPGVLELVDAHRVGDPDPAEIASLVFDVEERGYHLLLGLRRRRDWVALRARSLDAALANLRRCYRTVVADVSPDVEGHDQCGSFDVEERNLLARTVTLQADLVLLVGTPTMKGVHSVAALHHRLVEHGVEPTRMVAVVNHAPRSARQRREVAAALVALAGDGDDGAPLPVHFLPWRQRIDDALRAGTRLPASWCDQLRVATGVASSPAPERAPVPVRPGSIGRWASLGSALD